MTRDSGAGGANEASEATWIKLKISNSNIRHPISDEFKLTTSLPSRTVVYGRPEQHGGEADSSCLWAPGAVWHHCSVLQGQTEKKRRRGWKSMWKERVEKYRFKKGAGKRVVFFFFSSKANEVNDANEANSPKWSSSAIEASEVIVFASVAFSLNVPLVCIWSFQDLNGV